MVIKNIFFFILFLFVVSEISSQGRIVTYNDEVIDAVITEVRPTYISYRLIQDDGVKYMINKTLVRELVFYGDQGLEALIIDDYSQTIDFSYQRKKSFVKEPSFSDLMSKAEKHRLNANVYGVLTLYCIGGGIAFINAGSNGGRTNWKTTTIGIMLVVLGTPSIGVTAVIDKVNHLKYKNEIEEAFGITRLSHIPSRYDSNIMKLNLGLTANGVGLVLNF